MKVVRKYRLYLLAAGLLMTAVSTIVAPMIPMSADVTEFLPADEPAVHEWLELTNRFGALDLLMVGLEEPGEPLSNDSLQRIARITGKLSEHKADGVLFARSVTNLDTIRQDETGLINADLLVNKMPDTVEEHEAMMQRVLADTQARGSFVSHDLRAYMLLIRTNPDKDSRRVAEIVRSVVEEERGDMPAIYFGAPFIEGMITSQVYSTVPLIAGLFVVLLLIPILLMVRRLVAPLLVITTAGVALVWWLGLLQLLSIDLTATASGAALVLLALGAVLYARRAEQWLNRAPQGSIPPATPGFGYARLLVLALGGAAAYSTLMFWPVPFLAHFGQVMAVGLVAVALCGVLLFLPLLSYLRPHPTPGAGPPTHRIKPAIAVATAVLVLAGGVFAATKGRFLLNPREIFSADDEVGQAMSFFDRHFGGAEVMQIRVRGDFRNPGNCARLMRLTDLLEGSPLFGDVRSHSQVLAMLNGQFGGAYRIPPDPEALNNLWFFLEGNEDIRTLVTDNRAEAMIAVRIKPDSGIAQERWSSIAAQAIQQSAQVNPALTLERLLALRDRYGLDLDRKTLAALVDELALSASAQAQRKALLETLEKLRQAMQSDESPFEPTGEEWAAMEKLLQTVPGSQKSLATAIAGMDGFKDMEYPPEVAAEVASMLFEQRRAMLVNDRADTLMLKLKASLGSGPSARAYAKRARGILIELLDPATPDTDDLQIAVSGFPAVIPAVEQQVLEMVWWSALILWGVLLLVVLLLTRCPRTVLRGALEAATAMVLTFALGWMTRVNLDSASAVIYLLSPVAAWYCSPGLHSGGNHAAGLPGNRLAPAICLALAAASLSLMVSGVMPVFRLGAVLTLGLTCTAAIAVLARRVR